jgi:hypothetical protein
LKNHIKEVIASHPKKKRKKKRTKNKDGAVSRLISSPSHLSAVLRYFAGVAPYDIGVVHGMSHTKVFESIWIIVDAINKCEGLAFSFLKDHNKQRAIAKGFQRKSWAKFRSCCGCIDGMLLWTKRPTQADCKQAKVGSGKFFCGRNKKFGFCFQGVCDIDRKFLDVCIKHPASTSDYFWSWKTEGAF